MSFELHHEKFHKIVFALSKAQRANLRPEIESMQALLGDKSDLFSDKRGSHWRQMRSRPQLLVDIRGLGEYPATYEEVAELLGRTVQTTRAMLWRSKGVVHTTNDEGQVIRISKLK